MLSALSSARPDVLPRFRSRVSSTEGGQSKKSVKAEGQTADSNFWAWSIFRGKPEERGVRGVFLWGGVDGPSIRNFPWPFFSFVCSCMAFSRSWTVTSMGTIWPLWMCSLIMLPNSLFGRSCSARSRSPALKCLKP